MSTPPEQITDVSVGGIGGSGAEGTLGAQGTGGVEGLQAEVLAQLLRGILGKGGTGDGNGITDKERTQRREARIAADPTVQAGHSAYFSIWGVKAPEGYIENLVLQQGLNADEIVEHELAKGPARKTDYWRDKHAHFAAVLAQALGRR